MKEYVIVYAGRRPAAVPAEGLLETDAHYILFRGFRQGRSWPDDIVAVYRKQELLERPRAKAA